MTAGEHNGQFDRGLAMRRQVLGNEHVDASLRSADAFSYPIQAFITEYCWGGIWTRPGLSPRDRSLLNIGMLTALNRHHEFKVHVRGAINNGLTPDEIMEALLQAAVYCGAPAALESVRLAREVLRDMQPAEDAKAPAAAG